MHTTTIEISIKKGETQKLRFLIQQDIPYPRIHGESYNMRWENYDGLFRHYSQPATGLAQRYQCYLLASDAGDISKGWNRASLAGYDVDGKINPGTMIMRGISLGEMSIVFDSANWPKISVRGSETPNPSERKAVVELVCPKLLEYINTNRAALRAEAIEKVKARMAEVVAEARKRIDQLEAEAATAKF